MIFFLILPPPPNTQNTIASDSFVVAKHTWILNLEKNDCKDMLLNILLVCQYSGALLHSVLLVHVTMHWTVMLVLVNRPCQALTLLVDPVKYKSLNSQEMGSFHL